MAKGKLKDQYVGIGIADKDLKPLERLNRVFQDEHYHSVQRLEGKLLTIIDASFTDREQREAMKSLIRNAIWDNLFPMSQIIYQFSLRFDGKPIEALHHWKDSTGLPAGNFFLE